MKTKCLVKLVYNLKTKTKTYVLVKLTLPGDGVREYKPFFKPKTGYPKAKIFIIMFVFFHFYFRLARNVS